MGKGYLEVAPDPRLDLTSAVTLEAWVRPDQLAAGGARILDKSRVGTSNAYLLDTHPGGSLRLIVERGTLSYDAQLPADEWSHVAATVDAAGHWPCTSTASRLPRRTTRGPTRPPP